VIPEKFLHGSLGKTSTNRNSYRLRAGSAETRVRLDEPLLAADAGRFGAAGAAASATSRAVSARIFRSVASV